MKKRLRFRDIRRAYGVSWWGWVRFRFSRENRSYHKARREAEREREAANRRLQEHIAAVVLGLEDDK